MASSVYAPSPLTGAPLAPTYEPSPLPVTQPTPAYYAPSNLDISHGIIKNESGGRNVVSPQGARGPGQIMPGTFKQYALPGEHIDNPHDNMAVHHRIIADYERRWPNDPARVAVAYFSGPGNVAPPGSATPWKRNVSDVNESVSKYVANAVGAAGGKSGAPSTPAAPATAPSVGSALASLTKSDQTGKSPLENLEGMTQQQQPSGSGGGLQSEQFAAGGGMQRQAQLASQGAQLAAALKQQAEQPLSFNSAPYGAHAGLQNPAVMPQQFGQSLIPMPGTTLNTMGGGLV